MHVSAVRGAVGIEADSAAFQVEGVIMLVEMMMTENGIREEDIISIQFTITGDLRSRNPAAALRKRGFKDVPLFCSKEPDIAVAMKQVVRVLITAETDKEKPFNPVYIKGAEKLRPDIY